MTLKPGGYTFVFVYRISVKAYKFGKAYFGCLAEEIFQTCWNPTISPPYNYLHLELSQLSISAILSQNSLPPPCPSKGNYFLFVLRNAKDTVDYRRVRS